MDGVASPWFVTWSVFGLDKHAPTGSRFFGHYRATCNSEVFIAEISIIRVSSHRVVEWRMTGSFASLINFAPFRRRHQHLSVLKPDSPPDLEN